MLQSSDKKEFLKYIIDHFLKSKLKMSYLFEYIMNNVEQICFIDDYTNCEFVLQLEIMDNEDNISLSLLNQKSFDSFTGSPIVSIFRDIEDIFHEIRLNKEKCLYIYLSFNKKRFPQLFEKYVFVLEENRSLKDIRDHAISARYSDKAQNILDHAIKKYKENLLLNKINYALDQKDKEYFLKLTQELDKIRGEQNEPSKL